MSFETTFEEFVERLTRQYGRDEALRTAVPFCRDFARTLREQAETEGAEDPAALRRLADQMDPDLRSAP
ncbi:MAG TPA: hypothetical protein VFX60_18250 [Micromonospora sp.]|nr:hypothetical protein [Micromonospora sp.]